jgi:hypothetical protein
MRLLLRYIVFGLVALSSQIAAAQTVIRVAPPPPVHVGVVGRAPGPGYVWVEGYQRWNGSRYVWVGGRWVRPPRPGAVWVAPVYVRQGSAWAFRAGYWR